MSLTVLIAGTSLAKRSKRYKQMPCPSIYSRSEITYPWCYVKLGHEWKMSPASGRGSRQDKQENYLLPSDVSSWDRFPSASLRGSQRIYPSSRADKHVKSASLMGGFFIGRTKFKGIQVLL